MTGAELVVELQRPWRHGEHVDARGIVLEDPLILDGMDLRGFDLSQATLNGGLSARGARFRGLAWLRDAVVRGPCDLSGAQFRIDLRADALRADHVNLNDVIVQGVLSLAQARLDTLSLKHALVMANMTLENARISGATDLSGAETLGGLWTEGAALGRLHSVGLEVSGRMRMPSGPTRSNALTSAFSASNRA